MKKLNHKPAIRAFQEYVEAFGRYAEDDSTMLLWAFDDGRLSREELEEAGVWLQYDAVKREAYHRCRSQGFSPDKSILKSEVEAAEFMLRNDPPKKKPMQFENASSRQTMLLAGLDCAPGQLDLFETDGEA